MRNLDAAVGSGGARLRSMRLAAGLTQDRLSDLAQLHVRTVRGLETGRIVQPRRSTADALAAAMGLSLTVRAELLAAWEIYDSTPATTTAPQRGGGCVEVIEAHLARSRRELRIAAVAERALIGPDRRAARRWSQEVVVAQKSGVSTRVVHYEPMDETVDLDRFHLENLQNCEVANEVIDPSGHGKLFMFNLAWPLRAGQTHIAAYETNYARIRNTAAAPPAFGSEVTGFFHSPAIYVLEVQFQPNDPPILCEQVYQTRPTIPARSVAPLQLTEGRSCHIALLNPRPGGHGIAWRW